MKQLPKNLRNNILEITTDMIKSLREETSAGVMDCKKALEEAKGDLSTAISLLRQKGIANVAKKTDRATNEGIIESYIHGNSKVGAMVELVCETDFVARMDEFKELAHNLAMQVEAMNPQYLVEDEIEDKSTNDDELLLMKQAFIKDSSKNISDLVTDLASKVGENIKVRRFSRFELGN